VACTGDRRGAYRVMVKRRDGKRPLGKTRLRWEKTINMDLQEVGWLAMDWNDLVQDTDCRRGLVNAVMNFGVS